MGNKSKFMKIVDRVPVDNDKLVGQGVSWFVTNQDPDEIKFKQFKNGISIQIKMDEESAGEARQFWEEYVEPHLGGGE